MQISLPAYGSSPHEQEKKSSNAEQQLMTGTSTSLTLSPSDSNFFPYCFLDLVELFVTNTSLLPCTP
jgi:hypothetical protein